MSKASKLSGSLDEDDHDIHDENDKPDVEKMTPHEVLNLFV